MADQDIWLKPYKKARATGRMLESERPAMEEAPAQKRLMISDSTADGGDQ